MRLLFTAVLVSSLAVYLAGCTKCSPKSLMKSEEVMLSGEAIGKSLAPVICEKYSSCNKDNPQFNKEQCLQEISTGIAENLKTSTDLKINQTALDGCKKSIETAACEALNSATPPLGCEFLQ